MKKNKTPLTQPLSERELNWLQSYLDNLSQTNADFMTLEAIDGLFCALIINPVMAKPADWMNTIFGKKQAFNSDEELENVMMLLIRYWNHMSVLIENHSETQKEANYLPRINESDDYKLAEQWAAGFHIGMNYCANDWKNFMEDEANLSLLAPFVLLKQGHYPGQKNEILTQKDRAELVTMIPEAAHRLFHYWIAKTQTENTASKTKVGRNEPCPCGSGKKYKKCCDA